MSDIPYSNAVVATVDAGTNNCIELNVPPRGVIKRIVVSQTSGDADGFSCRVYDRQDACPGETQVAETVGTTVPTLQVLPRAAHQLTDDMVAANGEAELTEFDLDIPYTVKNAPIPGTITQKGGLTLWLSPGGAGSKNFTVAYTVLGLQTG